MSAFAAQPTGNTWRIHASQISGYTEVILACPGSFRCSCSSGIGVLLDRFAPRHIILPSILIFALALARSASWDHILATFGQVMRRLSDRPLYTATHSE